MRTILLAPDHKRWNRAHENAGIQKVEGVMFTEQRKEELATALR